MKWFFAKYFSRYEEDFTGVIKNFKDGGTLIGNENRNIIKFFEIRGRIFNFKSFKQHNIINRHIYKFYRKSKARRSFEYAELLLEKKFYTPKPIAYVENHDWLGLTSSFYISEQLENCYNLQDILFNKEFPERTEVIKGYTLLIYNFHENGIQFIDNAAGNFLVRKQENVFCFYVVDLNRMNFHNHMGIKRRLKNFSRFTIDKEIINIISEEYASLSGIPASYCFKKIDDASRSMLIKRKVKKVLKLYKYLVKI